MPLATYNAPSAPPSEVMPSSTGDLLSTPTEDTSQLAPRRPDTVWPFLYSEHHAYDEQIRYKPFPDMTTVGRSRNDTGKLEFRTNLPCLFPWKFEFAWESSGYLLFAGERFSTKIVNMSSSEVSIVTQEDRSAISETTWTTSAASSSSDDSLPTRLYKEGMISKAIYEIRESLVCQLENHYWRTYAPPRSSKRSRNRNSPSVNNAGHRVSAKGVTGQSSAKPRHSRWRKISDSSGNGDDDDEDNGDDRSSMSGRILGHSRYFFACPFMKWRPQHFFKSCGVHLTTISHVKDHLEKKHYSLHCPTCLRVFHGKIALRSHVNLGCSRPPVPVANFVTVEQLTVIKKRPYKYEGCEEQWRNIFKTLFPNEPQPLTPYLDPPMNEVMRHLTDYVSRRGSEFLRRLQHEMSIDNSTAYETPEAQFKAVWDDWFPRIFSQYMSQDELYSDIFQDQASPGDNSPTRSANLSLNNNEVQAQFDMPLTTDSLAQLSNSVGLSQPTSVLPLQPRRAPHEGQFSAIAQSYTDYNSGHPDEFGALDFQGWPSTCNTSTEINQSSWNLTGNQNVPVLCADQPSGLNHNNENLPITELLGLNHFSHDYQAGPSFSAEHPYSSNVSRDFQGNRHSAIGVQGYGNFPSAETTFMDVTRTDQPQLADVMSDILF